MNRSRVVALCNQKGGVGKTTVACALAGELAASGNVLVVDMDPQATATRAFGIEVADGQRTMLDALASTRSKQVEPGAALAGIIVQAMPPWYRVWVGPAERDLATCELDGSVGREALLRRALEAARSTFDWILVDCPPSLGILTTNALVAADTALIVTEPREASVAAVAEMVATISAVRTAYAPWLTLAGVVVNKWMTHRLDRAEQRDALQAMYGDYLIDAAIPDKPEVIGKATTAHTPIPSSATDVHEAVAAIADRLRGVLA